MLLGCAVAVGDGLDLSVWVDAFVSVGFHINAGKGKRKRSVFMFLMLWQMF